MGENPFDENPFTDYDFRNAYMYEIGRAFIRVNVYLFDGPHNLIDTYPVRISAKQKWGKVMSSLATRYQLNLRDLLFRDENDGPLHYDENIYKYVPENVLRSLVDDCTNNPNTDNALEIQADILQRGKREARTRRLSTKKQKFNQTKNKKKR